MICNVFTDDSAIVSLITCNTFFVIFVAALNQSMRWGELQAGHGGPAAGFHDAARDAVCEAKCRIA